MTNYFNQRTSKTLRWKSSWISCKIQHATLITLCMSHTSRYLTLCYFFVVNYILYKFFKLMARLGLLISLQGKGQQNTPQLCWLAQGFFEDCIPSSFPGWRRGASILKPVLPIDYVGHCFMWITSSTDRNYLSTNPLSVSQNRTKILIWPASCKICYILGNSPLK